MVWFGLLCFFLFCSALLCLLGSDLSWLPAIFCARVLFIPMFLFWSTLFCSTALHSMHSALSLSWSVLLCSILFWFVMSLFFTLFCVVLLCYVLFWFDLLCCACTLIYSAPLYFSFVFFCWDVIQSNFVYSALSCFCYVVHFFAFVLYSFLRVTEWVNPIS